jgi:TPR repeat protein
MRFLTLTFIALVALAGTAAADPLGDAAAAAYRGDYGTAAKIYRPLADAGNPVAQNNLGSLYSRGLGVTQDHVEADRLYLAAAEQGLAAAQNNLGYQYELGLGLPKDLDAALMWYRRSAEQDYALAQFSLGLFYANGMGVPKDNVTAFMWYGLATASGLAPARAELARLAITMTPDEIAAGQKLRSEWRAAHK